MIFSNNHSGHIYPGSGPSGAFPRSSGEESHDGGISHARGSLVEDRLRILHKPAPPGRPPLERCYLLPDQFPPEKPDLFRENYRGFPNYDTAGLGGEAKRVQRGTIRARIFSGEGGGVTTRGGSGGRSDVRTCCERYLEGRSGRVQSRYIWIAISTKNLMFLVEKNLIRNQNSITIIIYVKRFESTIIWIEILDLTFIQISTLNYHIYRIISQSFL